ncbi:CUB and zona pellucida-like domain-containing protein 1 [Physella acuta]|uniref:CUB and zona pellucida-like domain-containing protein 1 n=1 Tax=Physella acuta TaxID=109671 RepID=UPI0027DE22FB|nr:CUB and zona pellucida-like domain-containing protein 1 [Physella acuta]
MVSTTNNLFVTFDTGRGFYGEFYSQDTHTILNEPKGVISSPGYPIGCLGNMFYTWTIQGNAYTYIVLNVSDFDFGDDCVHENLTIHDGPSNNSTLIGTFCSSKPWTIESTSNYLYLEYKANGLNTHKGFYANYEIKDNHITLSDPQGNISSPGYPFGNLHKMRYTWTIQGDADSYILLDISDLGEDCQHDYLKIYDGPTTFSPIFGNFCSSVPPGLMASTGNSMFIVFKQHGPNTYKGFVGNYEIRAYLLWKHSLVTLTISLCMTELHRMLEVLKTFVAGEFQS